MHITDKKRKLNFNRYLNCTPSFQANDVFESAKDVARIHTPEPHSESNVERVSETSQDVALLNSDIVSTKEKSTKDKVSGEH